MLEDLDLNKSVFMILRKVLLTIPILCSLIYLLFVLVNPVWFYSNFSISEPIFLLMMLVNLVVIGYLVLRELNKKGEDSKRMKKICLILFFTPYVIVHIWNEY